MQRSRVRSSKRLVNFLLIRPTILIVLLTEKENSEKLRKRVEKLTKENTKLRRAGKHNKNSHDNTAAQETWEGSEGTQGNISDALSFESEECDDDRNAGLGTFESQVCYIEIGSYRLLC